MRKPIGHVKANKERKPKKLLELTSRNIETQALRHPQRGVLYRVDDPIISIFAMLYMQR